MSDTAEKNESGKEVTGNAGIGVGCNLKLGGRGSAKSSLRRWYFSKLVLSLSSAIGEETSQAEVTVSAKFLRQKCV